MWWMGSVLDLTSLLQRSSQLHSEVRSGQFAKGRQGLPLSVMESACCHLEGDIVHCWNCEADKIQSGRADAVRRTGPLGATERNVLSRELCKEPSDCVSADFKGTLTTF